MMGDKELREQLRWFISFIHESDLVIRKEKGDGYYGSMTEPTDDFIDRFIQDGRRP